MLNNLNLNNYAFEFNPTETSTGGALFHIANHLSCKCRNDLNIYKKNDDDDDDDDDDEELFL